MAEFVSYIGVEVVLDDGTVLECENSETLFNITGVSRGIGNMEEAGFAEMSGPTPTDRRAFMVVKMVDGSGVLTWENGNSDTLTMQIAPGMCFMLGSATSFDVSTTAGDATASDTGLDVDTAQSGRGASFEYFVLTGPFPAPNEAPCDAFRTLKVTVTDETDAAIEVRGSDGHMAFLSPFGALTVYANDDASIALEELGTWCVYPSDVNGTLSGSWVYLGIGFGGVAPVDLSPLNGSGPMADPTDIESIYIESVPWPSVELPLLIGTNAPFRLNSSTVTTVTVPPSTKFRAVEVGAPINSASVDALCNSLDPTVTGQATQFVGTAPATAASLPNRLAYIANGNTITFT